MNKKKIFSLLMAACLLFGNVVYGENPDTVDNKDVQADIQTEEKTDVYLKIEEVENTDDEVSSEGVQAEEKEIEKEKFEEEKLTESTPVPVDAELPEEVRQLAQLYDVSTLSLEDVELLSEYPQSSEKMFDEQLRSMNYPRAKFSTVEIGDKIYVLGGINDDGIVKTVERYNYRNDTWENVTNLPVDIRDFGVAAIGNTIYIAGGYINGDVSNRVYAYDILTDTWTEKASMTEKRARHAFINADGLLYAVGGRNNSGTLKSVETYNFADNTWTKIADISDSRMDAAIAYGYGKIYIIGGFDEKAGYIGSCECYDIQEQIWSSIEGIGNIENMYTRPNALVYGNDIHVYWKGADPSGYIWQSVYNINNNSWDEPICTWLNNSYFSVATVEDGICILGGYKDDGYTANVNYKYNGSKPNIVMEQGIIKAETVCIDNEIYTIGGKLSTGVDSTFINKYSSDESKWINVTSMPSARRGFSAEVIGSTIYIIGGYCNGKYEREILAYDTLNNRWSVESRLPVGMERMATTTAGNKLYVIGGRYDSGVLNTMYAYDFSSKLWTTLSNTLRAGMDFGCESINGKIYLIGGRDSYLPLTYVDEYDIETNQWTNKLSDFPTFEYLKTVLHDGRIVITAQNSYDGTENVTFKEYLPSQNTVIDSTLGSKFSNTWYGLASNNIELWLIGGFDGEDYSNIIKVINDNGQSEAYNNKTLTCTQNKSYNIYVYGGGINNFKDKVFMITYDSSVLSPEDLCAFTPSIDMVDSNQYIKGTDILIKKINKIDGIIEFTINRDLPQYSIWEGNLNVIRFKALKSGNTKINILGTIADNS